METNFVSWMTIVLLKFFKSRGEIVLKCTLESRPDISVSTSITSEKVFREHRRRKNVCLDEVLYLKWSIEVLYFVFEFLLRLFSSAMCVDTELKYDDCFGIETACNHV